MKQSEKLIQDSDNKRSLIDSYRKEIDLRAGQIDKLRQEIDSYQGEINKAEVEHERLLNMAQQEQEKEADEDRRNHQQMLMNAAQNLSDRS